MNKIYVHPLVQFNVNGMLMRVESNLGKTTSHLVALLMAQIEEPYDIIDSIDFSADLKEVTSESVKSIVRLYNEKWTTRKLVGLMICSFNGEGFTQAQSNISSISEELGSICFSQLDLGLQISSSIKESVTSGLITSGVLTQCETVVKSNLDESIAIETTRLISGGNSQVNGMNRFDHNLELLDKGLNSVPLNQDKNIVGCKMDEDEQLKSKIEMDLISSCENLLGYQQICALSTSNDAKTGRRAYKFEM